ncbi:hypothetical protein [Nostoc sp. UCD121]|nr:hypothetical protein [Nostoc sp. UCD121]
MIYIQGYRKDHHVCYVRSLRLLNKPNSRILQQWKILFKQALTYF